jgi:hypothetical protein
MEDSVNCLFGTFFQEKMVTASFWEYFYKPGDLFFCGFHQIINFTNFCSVVNTHRSDLSQLAFTKESASTQKSRQFHEWVHGCAFGKQTPDGSDCSVCDHCRGSSVWGSNFSLEFVHAANIEQRWRQGKQNFKSERFEKKSFLRNAAPAGNFSGNDHGSPALPQLRQPDKNTKIRRNAAGNRRT